MHTLFDDLPMTPAPSAPAAPAAAVAGPFKLDDRVEPVDTGLPLTYGYVKAIGLQTPDGEPAVKVYWPEMRDWNIMPVAELRPKAPRHQLAETVGLADMRGVVQLLETASQHLRFPKLQLVFGDGLPLRISIAGPRSKTPGYLMLTDGARYPDNRFYGRISPEGVLELYRDGERVREPLFGLLQRLADKPAEVAAEYGRMTGHCCFCRLPLKDERSTAVGYGPVCAENYGLPWGAK